MVLPSLERSLTCMVEKIAEYAIFLLDEDGVIQTWNPAATLMKGYRADEVIGRHFGMLYTDEQRAAGHPDHNLRHAAAHGTFQEEAWRLRKDGTCFWAMVEIIAINDEAGTLSGYCKLTRDITGKRDMEDTLRDADRRKDEFLATLAHELRNPLAPISAAAELLSTGKLEGDSVRKAGRVIGRQVRHMTALVDDLLDVARVARGEIVLDLSALDMRSAVNNAIEQARPLIDSRRHTLSVTLEPVTAHVRGDEKRLVQVIANLLNNAAKFTAPGGHIGINLSAAGGQVRVEVADDGIGIAQEAQAAIFELFEQAQRSSERGTGGMGIGLSLVRSIVGLHGGSVACHSDGPGQGSRFSISLPGLAPDGPMPERRRPERMDEPAMAEPSLSVLVVDDHIDAAQMVEFFLLTAGHTVRLAHSARAAMDEVIRAMPDVCILDIGLPDSSGRELADAIRQRGSPAPLLIALSGHGMARHRDREAEAGFDAYFVKPVDLDALTAVLAGATRRH